jgi:uncharacterized protein (TIGR02678 family)
MNALELLLGRRWILKSREKELYYQAKDELGKVKDFLVEKLGYQIIINPYLIKIEKIPAEPENWMGIREFKEKQDYILFCYILMFLENKEAEEQFVLSELTEYVQANCKEMAVDWTLYQHRRSLIRVMKFCVQSGILDVDDGNEESFAKDYTSEVLYENTGASRYFMKNFTRDISGYTKPEEFEQEEWIDMNEDRGFIRRQRVYRRLLMSMGFVRTAKTEEDFVYVRNYRNTILGELSKYLECDLHVHKSGAFLILGEDSRLGRCFPEENTISDITLLCCGLIRREIDEGRIPVPADEQIVITLEQFQQLVEQCRNQYRDGFIKSYRELTTSEFVREVTEYMEEMELIEISEQRVLLNTAIGKIVGEYPADYQSGGKHE